MGGDAKDEVSMGGDAGPSDAGEEDADMCEHKLPFNHCKKCQPPLIGIVCVCLCVYDVGVCACVCVCVCVRVCGEQAVARARIQIQFFCKHTDCMHAMLPRHL